jgi:hypothetical protein
VAARLCQGLFSNSIRRNCRASGSSRSKVQNVQNVRNPFCPRIGVQREDSQDCEWLSMIFANHGNARSISWRKIEFRRWYVSCSFIAITECQACGAAWVFPNWRDRAEILEE